MMEQVILVNFSPAKMKFWASYAPELNAWNFTSTEFLNKIESLEHSQNHLFIIFFEKISDEERKILEISKKYLSSLVGFVFLVNKDALASEKTLIPLRPVELTQAPNIFALFEENEWNVASMISVLKNYIVNRKIVNQSEEMFHRKMKEVSLQFDVAIDRLEKQLLVAREKHFKKQSSRFIRFNKLKFDYQYRVGVQSGAEYSDFLFIGDNVLWLNFSCQSYSTSSVLLKFIEDCRNNKKNWKSDYLKNILKELHSTIDTFQKNMEKKLEFSYFFMNINVLNYQAECEFTGDYKFYLGPVEQKELVPNKIQLIKLSKIEPFLLMTPGIKRNIYNGSKLNAISKFVEDNLSKLRNEILAEIFIMVEKEDGTPFLDYDLNLVYGEVVSDE